MKKYIILGIIILAVVLGSGAFALFSALSGGPWEGVWWGVQEAGMNWSGDNPQPGNDYIHAKRR